MSAKSANIVGQIVRTPTALCCRIQGSVWFVFTTWATSKPRRINSTENVGERNLQGDSAA